MLCIDLQKRVVVSRMKLYCNAITQPKYLKWRKGSGWNSCIVVHIVECNSKYFSINYIALSLHWFKLQWIDSHWFTLECNALHWFTLQCIDLHWRVQCMLGSGCTLPINFFSISPQSVPSDPSLLALKDRPSLCWSFLSQYLGVIFFLLNQLHWIRHYKLCKELL